MQPAGSFAVPRRTLLFVLTCSVLTIDSLAWGVVVPFLPERSRDLGASTIDVTLIYAAYLAGLLLFTIPAGIASDRIGRKPVIVAGGFGMAAATLAFTFADSTWLLLLTRFAMGLTGAFWWVPGLAVIADLYPANQRGARLGLAMSITAGGDLVGPGFGGTLAEIGSYRLPLLVLAAGCLLTAPAFAAFYRHVPIAEKQRRQSLRGVMLHPTVLVVCGTAVLAAFGIGMLQPLLPLHMADEFGAGPAEIGFVFTAPVAGFILAGALVGRLSDRIGRKAPMLFGVILCAMVIPLPAMVGSLVLIAGATLLIGFAEGVMEAPALPLLAEVSETGAAGEAGQFGAVYGVFDTSFALGGLIGPVAGGVLVAFIDLRLALLLYSAVLLAYLPLLWWRLRTVHATPRATPVPALTEA